MDCESWTIKQAECRRIDVFEPWCWWRLLRVPWTTRRSNQSILKEISPGCSLEGLILKLKLQYFGHLMGRTDSFEKTLMLGKIEGRRRGDNRWDGWMASPTQWTWVWVGSGSWCWTGRPGMLQLMGSWAKGRTRLSDWTEHKENTWQLWEAEYEPQRIKELYRRKDCWPGNSAEEWGGHVSTHQLSEAYTLIGICKVKPGGARVAPWFAETSVNHLKRVEQRTWQDQVCILDKSHWPVYFEGSKVKAQKQLLNSHTNGIQISWHTRLAPVNYKLALVILPLGWRNHKCCCSYWPSKPPEGVQDGEQIRGNSVFGAGGGAGWQNRSSDSQIYSEADIWAQLLYLFISRKALKPFLVMTVPHD